MFVKEIIREAIAQKASENFKASGLEFKSFENTIVFNQSENKWELGELSPVYKTYDWNLVKVKSDNITFIQAFLNENCNEIKPWPAFHMFEKVAKGPGYLGHDVIYNLNNQTVNLDSYMEDHPKIMRVVNQLPEKDIGCYLREFIGADALADYPNHPMAGSMRCHHGDCINDWWF